MSTGAPIYDEDQVRAMQQALDEGIYLEHKRKDRRGNMRDALYFHMAINTALRTSDLLQLQPRHVLRSYTHGDRTSYDWKRHWIVTESKNGKERRIVLPRQTKTRLRKYIDEFKLEPDEYVFFSMANPSHHVHRTQIYRRLVDVAIAVGIPNFTLHSLRKTLPRKVWDDTGNLALCQKILNHSSPEMTMRYLGIRQDEIDNVLEEYAY